MTAPIRTTDPIIGPARLSYDDAVLRVMTGNFKTAREWIPVIDYLREVYRLAPLVGLCPEIIVAQSSIETGNWGVIAGAGATAWLERNNPACIGVTSTGKPGEKDIDAGHSWANGTDAARAQIVHLQQYLDRSDSFIADTSSEVLYQYFHLDPRRNTVYEAGFANTVRLLSDLGNGRWAADRDYAEKVAARGNQIFGFQEEPTMPPLNMTKGLVPMPGFDDEAGTFTKVNGVGCNYLGKRNIDVLFFHRALGNGARGVADWLKRRDVQGLTDWVIDAETAYMIRLVDITAPNPPSGWAQGPYRAPVPDLQKLTAKYGGDVNTINRHGESIEVSDFYGDPISPACKRDLAQWTASRAHDRGIAWDRFPLTPDGYSFIYGHFEACGKDIKPCCGDVVWEFINDGELIAMVRGILKAAQTGSAQTPATTTTAKPATPKPAYAKPLPIKSLQTLDLSDRKGLEQVTTKEGAVFRSVDDQVVATQNTPRYRVANPESPQRVGPDIRAGEDFNPAWEFTDGTGKEWYVTPMWSRVRKQHTKVVSIGPLKA